MSRKTMQWILFCSFCCCVSPNLWAQRIKEGLEYQQIATPDAQVVHVLEIDPHKFTIAPKHAKGQAVGLDSLATLAREHNAIAAINGGFFHMGEGKDGLPAGILKIKGQWYGIAYSNRAAVGWWENKASLLISRLQTKTSFKIQQHTFPVYAVNQPGSTERSILFTSSFGKYADSAAGGKDIVIQNNRITQIIDAGQTEIPTDGYVYSMGANVTPPFFIPRIHDAVTVNIHVLPDAHTRHPAALWQTIDHIVGGTPLLIENGKVLIEANSKQMQTAFGGKRRARTAFGILNNGHWVWVVVEKNQLHESAGMTLTELADFLKNLNCQHAVNMDGGSSSAMYLDNKLITAPEEDNTEELSVPMFRPIADAILILDKKAE